MNPFLFNSWVSYGMVDSLKRLVLVCTSLRFFLSLLVLLLLVSSTNQLLNFEFLIELLANFRHRATLLVSSVQ